MDAAALETLKKALSQPAALEELAADAPPAAKMPDDVAGDRVTFDDGSDDVVADTEPVPERQ